MNLKTELILELINNILPYWIHKTIDEKNGGFYGRIDGNEIIHKNANKGIILNARILWTFSAAYKLVKYPEYLVLAKRAYYYLIEKFIDKEHGGVFWELDYTGNPVNTKKQTCAQGYALYGLSEFYKATGKEEALELALNIFQLIEKNCRDISNGGYFESFTNNWKPVNDMRLSQKEPNVNKSLNANLHVLEAYTNLLQVCNTSDVLEAQNSLIHVFTDKILNKQTNHLNLFFDEKWKPKSNAISYGHDIETSWLLIDAAKFLCDDLLSDKIKEISLKIAEAAFEGLQPDGSLIYQKNGNRIDTERHWWVQSETVVGAMTAWHITGNNRYLEIATKCWNYIKQFLIDRIYGEWIWSANHEGVPNRNNDKVGFWKCPYHNGRMCLKMLEMG